MFGYISPGSHSHTARTPAAHSNIQPYTSQHRTHTAELRPTVTHNVTHNTHESDHAPRCLGWNAFPTSRPRFCIHHTDTIRAACPAACCEPHTAVQPHHTLRKSLSSKLDLSSFSSLSSKPIVFRVCWWLSPSVSFCPRNASSSISLAIFSWPMACSSSPMVQIDFSVCRWRSPSVFLGEQWAITKLLSGRPPFLTISQYSTTHYAIWSTPTPAGARARASAAALPPHSALKSMVAPSE